MCGISLYFKPFLLKAGKNMHYIFMYIVHNSQVLTSYLGSGSPRRACVALNEGFFSVNGEGFSSDQLTFSVQFF